MAAVAPLPRPAAPVGAGVARRALDDRRRWLALVALCIGQLMIVLDVTIVNVALPSIQSSLHFSPTSLAWVVNGYLIGFGGLLLLAGRLGDLLGRRRVFLLGLAGFTVASIFCGLAPTGELLVVARFVQGVAASAIGAMVLGILVTLFPTQQQTARAMSVYAMVASMGGAIGLLAGGTLTQALSWHWIFFVNVPIGLAAMALGFALIPAHVGSGLRHGVDVVGAVLVTAAPMLAIYTILQASESGWTTLRTLWLGTVSVLVAALFVAVESRVRAPLVPLRIFRSRNVSGANLVRALFPVGMFGSLFIGTLYVQKVLGYDALRAGLAFLPQALAIGTFSMLVVGRLVDRFSLKTTLLLGLLLVASGLALFARMPLAASYPVDVLPVTLLIGMGAGLIFMPSVALAMSDAPRADSGVASGLANVALQIGAALGVAVLAGVASDHARSLVAAGVPGRVALASGYQLALLVASGCVLAAVAIGAWVLRSPAAPRVEPVAAAVGAD